MRTLFSTKDVHPRERFEYWHEVACQCIVHHESRPERRSTFQAELHTAGLDQTELLLFENEAMHVSRTPSHIARTPGDGLFVYLHLSGQLHLEQSGREQFLRPGEFTLVDPSLPYIAKFSGGSKSLILKVPRHAFEIRLGKIRDSLLCPVKPTDPQGSLTAAYLGMLPAHAEHLGETAKRVVEDHVLDMVAVSLSSVAGHSRPGLSSARSFVLMSVRSAIEARLSDPTLNPSEVSAIAGVSVRYANAVLAREGTSIGRLILLRRLERCRKALEDPAQANRTLQEIAFGWGFSDMTHFGRRFKSAYGILPSEYRRNFLTSLA